MARDYEESARLRRIGDKLIESHHPHLKNVAIGYAMKTLDDEAELKPMKPGRDGKKAKFARARLVSPLYRLFTDLDFIVEADERYWNLLNLDQQEALIDHELTHCARDEKGYYVRDHDVEEFRSILERHGFWNDGLERFVNAAKQVSLPFGGHDAQLKDDKGNILYEQKSGKVQ